MTTRYREVFSFLKKYEDEGKYPTSEEVVAFAFTNATDEETPILIYYASGGKPYSETELNRAIEIMERHGFDERFIDALEVGGACAGGGQPLLLLQKMAEKRLGGTLEDLGQYDKFSGSWQIRKSNG